MRSTRIHAGYRESGAWRETPGSPLLHPLTNRLANRRPPSTALCRSCGKCSPVRGTLSVFHNWDLRGHVMGLLRLAVLGAPEVFHDGVRLTFALRKAQALLIYLAVEGGMHSRNKLTAFLWPDSEPRNDPRSLLNASPPLPDMP